METKFKKRNAFTLAEVLITLAIIGVVAALTIPTVVRNYQKMQLKVALKKQWSIINQTLNKVAFDMGGAQSMRCYHGTNGLAHEHEGCPKFFENFFKELKVQKVCKGNSLRDGCQPVYNSYPTIGECYSKQKDALQKLSYTYILADGTLIIPAVYYGSSEHKYAGFAIDTNGLKGPNKTGYDLFSVYFSFNGKKLYFNNNISECLIVSPGGLYDFSNIDKW